MADLSSYSKIIKEASEGEAVRDAFIQLVKFLNTMEGSIGTLNGHPESYFAKYSDLVDFVNKINDAIIFDTESEYKKPIQYSTHMLTSGYIYDAVEATNSVLNDINHEVLPIEKLINSIKRIEEAKDAIGRAIRVQSGGLIKKKQLGDFENYAELIRTLVSKETVRTTNPTLDKNGDYEPDEENEDPTYTNAYRKVTTDVKFKTETFNARENRTLTAEGDSIGFSKITVNTSSTSAGSGRSGSSRGGGGNVDENGIQETTTIVENGTHTPKGAIGWRTVVVDVQDIEIDFDAKYVVNFYDSESKNKLLYSDKAVPYNGSTSCPEDLIPQREGLYFAGWEPPPFKIREDTDCIAQFTDQEPSVEEISYTWDEIVEARGANCRIGAYKTLHLDNGYGDIRMQKVYAGEGGTTSSWLAMDHVNSRQYFYNERIEYGPGTVGWSGSDIRKWLNNTFFYNYFPELLRDNVIEVPKYSFEYSFDYASKIITEVRDKIWIPSLKELLGDIPPEGMDTASAQQVNSLFFVSGSGGAYNNEILPNGRVMLNWGMQRDSNMEYYRPEYKGVHYKDVYPGWQVNTWGGIDGREEYAFSFSPTSTTALARPNYPYPNAYYWMTRSCTTVTGCFNSNYTGLFAAAFKASDGGYYPLAKCLNGNSGSFNEGNFMWPMIGFCL